MNNVPADRGGGKLYTIFQNITILIRASPFWRKALLCVHLQSSSAKIQSLTKGRDAGLIRAGDLLHVVHDLRPWYKLIIEKLRFLPSLLFCQLACLAKSGVNASS